MNDTMGDVVVCRFAAALDRGATVELVERAAAVSADGDALDRVRSNDGREFLLLPHEYHRPGEPCAWCD